MGGAKEQREGQQLVAPHTPARKWPAGRRLLLIGQQGRAQHFIHDKPDLLQSLVGAGRAKLLQQEVMELRQEVHSGKNSSNQPTKQQTRCVTCVSCPPGCKWVVTTAMSCRKEVSGSTEVTSTNTFTMATRAGGGASASD